MSRRIITGNNNAGLSQIVSDGQAFEFGTLTELWVTDTSPSGYGSDDEVAGRRVKLEPPESGTIFRFFRVEPEAPGKSREELVREVCAGLSAIDAAHCRPNTARHPRMHTTSSIDYVVLVRGEVTLLLDEGEVDLKPFDVVVQRGTNHAWINKGTETAELVGVLVSAQKR